MARVTGIGGIFIGAKDPKAMCSWYKTHLGIDIQDWGGTAFQWINDNGVPIAGTTAFSIGDGSNFEPSKSPFMVNYRVDDLRTLLGQLRIAKCRVIDNIEESEFGKFGWVMDPEGNKVELWEPPEGQ